MTTVPPLSPLLLAGVLMRPAPMPVMRSVAWPLLAALRRTLAAVLVDRLPYDGIVRIEPLELPVALLLTAEKGHLDLDLVAPGMGRADAVIRAPLDVLLQIAGGDGALDGDAGLFSRRLELHGDVGLAMAVRYALEQVDAAPLNLLERMPGGRPMAAIAGRLAAWYGRAADDLERVRQAAVEPLRAELARQDARMRDLADEVADLRRRVPSPSRMREAADGNAA